MTVLVLAFFRYDLRTFNSVLQLDGLYLLFVFTYVNGVLWYVCYGCRYCIALALYSCIVNRRVSAWNMFSLFEMHYEKRYSQSKYLFKSCLLVVNVFQM